jgi:hypothetical protein
MTMHDALGIAATLAPLISSLVKLLDWSIPAPARLWETTFELELISRRGERHLNLSWASKPMPLSPSKSKRRRRGR